MSNSIAALIERGGVYHDIDGTDPQSVFKDIAQKVSFPASLDKELVINELLERENVLSTAVGGGIAIPHAKRPVVKNPKDECIIVCFLKNQISMQAPDGRPVNVFFILLSDSQISHIQSLSVLAKMFRNQDFKRLIASKPLKAQLVSFLQRTVF